MVPLGGLNDHSLNYLPRFVRVEFNSFTPRDFFCATAPIVRLPQCAPHSLSATAFGADILLHRWPCCTFPLLWSSHQPSKVTASPGHVTACLAWLTSACAPSPEQPVQSQLRLRTLWTLKLTNYEWNLKTHRVPTKKMRTWNLEARV